MRIKRGLFKFFCIFVTLGNGSIHCLIVTVNVSNIHTK